MGRIIIYITVDYIAFNNLPTNFRFNINAFVQSCVLIFMVMNAIYNFLYYGLKSGKENNF